MFKYLTPIIIVWPVALFGQFDADVLGQVNRELSVIDGRKTEYFLRQDVEGSKIEFVKKEKGVVIELYKLLLNDIHPEGVFLLKKKNKITLKILSLNNERVFVFERRVNGVKLSENMKFIELWEVKKKYESEVQQIAEFLGKMLNSKVKGIVNPVDPPISRKN